MQDLERVVAGCARWQVCDMVEGRGGVECWELLGCTKDGMMWSLQNMLVVGPDLQFVGSW